MEQKHNQDQIEFSHSDILYNADFTRHHRTNGFQIYQQDGHPRDELGFTFWKAKILKANRE